MSAPASFRSPSWAVALTLLLFAAGCGGDSSGTTQPDDDPLPSACESTLRTCESRIEVANDLYVRYLRTFDLEEGHPEIRRAILIVHGLGRNHQGLFTTGIIAAKDAASFRETLVVSPYFQAADDNPAADEIFWSTGGWARGHLSSTAGPSPRRSSYDVMDQLIRQIAGSGRFPSLEEVVVVGHSAGGQYVHRYASGSRVENQFPALRFRYVVANPSSYLYLGLERPDGQGGFAIPDIEACPDYNVWHRGLEGRNNYMNQLTDEEIRDNLTGRDVRILGGNFDLGTADLDQSCGGNLQGETRYERSLNIMDYMDSFYPGHGHIGATVFGVAHSSRQMFTSSVGLSAIFD
jgi:hypothetical protein